MDDKRTYSLGLGALIGALAVLVLLAIAGLLVVYTGAYNVAATEQHTSLVRWAFDTTMHRGVERRAADVSPAAEVDPAMLARAGREYQAMCQHCHAGPGAEREPWADGMRPRPPHLVEAAPEWERQEVFWLVKHGVKMTGMRAFGSVHDDEMLWAIATFVKQLPAMTPGRYAAFDGGSRGRSGQPGGSEAGPHSAAGASAAASQAPGR